MDLLIGLAYRQLIFYYYFRFQSNYNDVKIFPNPGAFYDRWLYRCANQYSNHY
jgi:hypothetical protein